MFQSNSISKFENFTSDVKQKKRTLVMPLFNFIKMTSQLCHQRTKLIHVTNQRVLSKLFYNFYLNYFIISVLRNYEYNVILLVGEKQESF